MKISGICRVVNKWDDNEKKYMKDQFLLEIKQTNSGVLAFGKLSFSSSSPQKNKETGESEFISAVKPFVCFNNDAINTIEKTLGKLINIEGEIKIEKYVDKDNKKQTIEKFIINKASVFNKNDIKPNPHQEAKQNGYQKEATVEEDDSEEIPF